MLHIDYRILTQTSLAAPDNSTHRLEVCRHCSYWSTRVWWETVELLAVVMHEHQQEELPTDQQTEPGSKLISTNQSASVCQNEVCQHHYPLVSLSIILLQSLVSRLSHLVSFISSLSSRLSHLVSLVFLSLSTANCKWILGFLNWDEKTLFLSDSV